MDCYYHYHHRYQIPLFYSKNIFISKLIIFYSSTHLKGQWFGATKDTKWEASEPGPDRTLCGSAHLSLQIWRLGLLMKAPFSSTQKQVLATR